MKPKRGQVFLWSGRNLLAYGIQLFTRSRWSHCGWFLDENTILDSDWGWTDETHGVQIRSAKPFLKHQGNPKRLIIADLPLSPEKTEEALQNALSYVGKAGYDVRLFISLLKLAVMGKKCADDVRDWKDAFVCSEIIAQPCYDVANLRFVGHEFDIAATTPRDIFEGVKLV